MHDKLKVLCYLYFRILGTRVAELEKKLKTFEVAGLWTIPGKAWVENSNCPWNRFCVYVCVSVFPSVLLSICLMQFLRNGLFEFLHITQQQIDYLVDAIATPKLHFNIFLK